MSTAMMSAKKRCRANVTKGRLNEEYRRKAPATKRAIHRQYGDKRHCHGVALFVDAAMFDVH